MVPRDRIPANQLFTKSFGSLDARPNLPFCAFISQNLPFLSSHFFVSLDTPHSPKFLDRIPSTVMEYHSVPPEERARDEDGNLLPWGYVYKEYVRWFLPLLSYQS